MKKWLPAALLSCSLCLPAAANNVRVVIESAEPYNAIIEVKWENAWNLTDSVNNHDAVWVFFKSGHIGGSHPHAYIRNCTMLSDGTIKLSEDRVGIMLMPFVGAHEQISLKFRVDFNEMWQGQLHVHAVEMVYCPPGQFYAGDGRANNTFASSSGEPFLVSDTIISFHTRKGNFTIINPTADLVADSLKTSAFPTGVQGFYVMKYEINQKQFAAFLDSQNANDLRQLIPEFSGMTYILGDVRFRSAIQIDENTSASNSVHITVVTGQTGNGENRAVSYLNWDLLASYLDWSGLRPMTELEYEKACRGPKKPLKYEFAWGTQYVSSIDSLDADGTVDETTLQIAADTVGLAICSKPVGNPYVIGSARNGFAGLRGSSRIHVGAGYYSAFELSGNVWDMCVKVGHTAHDFNGAHGDGTLKEGAGANVAGWPTSNGIIAKGGGWNSLIVNKLDYQFRDLAVSDRFYVSQDYSSKRNTMGGRGCRSF